MLFDTKKKTVKTSSLQHSLFRERPRTASGKRGMPRNIARQLLSAIETGNVDTVKTLLQDPHTTAISLARVRDAERRPLVQLAVRHNRPAILTLLLIHGCSSRERSENYDDAEDDYRGRSPLCVAVELGHDDCARVLLAHGASVDAPSRCDGSLHTPLHVAAMFNVGTPFFHHKLLPSSTAIDASDFNDNTPLHLAAAYGAYDVAAALIKKGAYINAMNASGSTPLHLASSNGVVKIVQLLLVHGADVNAQDVLGNTPLIDAAFVNQSAVGHFAYGDAASQSLVMKRLLDGGADVNACNRDGNSAISGAVRNGYTDAVLALLDHGACVMKQNRNHENVLHIAARAGVASVEVWTRLLVAGADVLARDRYNRTCYCVWSSRPKLVADERPEEESGEEQALDINDDDDPVALVLEAALMAR